MYTCQKGMYNVPMHIYSTTRQLLCNINILSPGDFSHHCMTFHHPLPSARCFRPHFCLLNTERKKTQGPHGCFFLTNDWMKTTYIICMYYMLYIIYITSYVIAQYRHKTKVVNVCCDTTKTNTRWFDSVNQTMSGRLLLPKDLQLSDR